MTYSGPDTNIIIKSSGQHNHVGNSHSKLERQVLREHFKRRAEESLSTQPLKLIRNEILINLELSSIVHRFKNSSMYDGRRKILPELPKSTEDVFLLLNLMKT
jgi:hypothetical protein